MEEAEKHQVNVEKTPSKNVIFRLQNILVESMEAFFYFYGKSIASRPYSFISFSILLTCLSALGLLNFHQESAGVRLWMPDESEFKQNSEWLWANYPPSLRYASMLFLADNVLEAQNIRAIYRVRKEIANIRTSFNETWSDVCQKAPIMRKPDISTLMNLFNNNGKRRKKREESDFEFEDDVSFDEFGSWDDEFEEPDFDLDSLEGNYQDIGEYYNIQSYPQPYCQVVDSLDLACMEMSILELWANDGDYDESTEQTIAQLTTEEVLDKINSFNKSGVFLREKNFTELLSGITRDESGRIVSAKATFITWLTDMNMTEALENPVPNRPEPINQRAFEFEGKMLDVLLNKSNYPIGLDSYPHAKRSFGDVGFGAIFGDAKILILGYTVVITYIFLMLGRLNKVEQRIYAAMSGIISVIMGLVVCFGLSSAFGLLFGPMHSVLPFLLLGIGIDDMFVIVQCFENLKDQKLEPLERFGHTLKHAGVSITITSITDIAAFAVGGTTVLPGLRSFCLYASVGIVSIYFFQCTFFVACLSLDQRRIEAQRNGCFPCLKHKTWVPNAFSQRDFIRSAFAAVGHQLTKFPVKMAVLALTALLTGIGVYGNVLLKNEFDPTWFLPGESYLSKWFKLTKIYFPAKGDMVTINIADMDVYDNFLHLVNLTEDLRAQKDILFDVESWASDYEDYLHRNFLPKSQSADFYTNVNQSFFEEKLVQFLYSPRGAKYKSQFFYQSQGPPKCGDIKTTINFSFLRFHHFRFEGPANSIPPMNRIKTIVKNVNVTPGGRIFPIARSYSMWETDEVIGGELYRNLGLAMLAVFAFTMLLLSNLRASLMVFACVILSLFDVGGFMHFWGLTIDTVSSVNLIIAIGLCVDYSSHIAHRFLIEPGVSRDDRLESTLANIGPAVLNGGLTTTLAFILLANSQSHVFITFFKVFFLVVSFGLYHGLIVLPVVLSLIGPESHVVVQITQAEQQENHDNEESLSKKSLEQQQQENKLEDVA